MPDREKIIAAMEWCMENPCKGCPYEQNQDAEGRCSISDDTIVLLKEQDKRYAMMVVDWLRDMAHNNYLDSSHMTFWDAILDIRERAQTGLENYFRDYDSDTKRQEGR